MCDAVMELQVSSIHAVTSLTLHALVGLPAQPASVGIAGADATGIGGGVKVGSTTGGGAACCGTYTVGVGCGTAAAIL